MSEEGPIRWLATHEEHGRVLFRIGRSATSMVAESPDTAPPVASRAGHHLDLTFTDNLDPQTRDKIEHGTGMLLVRHLRGALGLHGGAVAIEGRALVLLGRSGAGKSTSAQALCTHFGAQLLADDAVALDPDRGSFGAERTTVRKARTNHGPAYVVVPTERKHWLWGDGGKRPCAAREVAAGAVPLAGFVELAFEDEGAAGVSEVAQFDVLEALVHSCARFVVDEDDVMRDEIERLSALALGVPFVRLRRPRDLGALEASHRPLVAWLESLPAP